MRELLKKYQGFLKLLFFFLFIFYLYWRIDWEFLNEFMGNNSLQKHFTAHSFWLVLCILLTALHLLIDGFKWKILIAHRLHIDFKTAMNGVLMGIPLGILTPQRIGDHGGRILAVKAEHNTSAFSASVWASLSQWVACILLAIILFPFFPFDINVGLRILLFLFLVGILCIIIYYAHFTEQLKVFIPRRFRSSRWIQSLYENRGLKEFMYTVFLSLCRYLIFSFQFLILLYIIGRIELDFMNYLIAVAVLVIQSFIPIPGLLSVATKAEIAILLFNGINETEIVLAAFLLWILNLFIPSVIGIILLFKNNLQKSLIYENRNSSDNA